MRIDAAGSPTREMPSYLKSYCGPVYFHCFMGGYSQNDSHIGCPFVEERKVNGKIYAFMSPSLDYVDVKRYAYRVPSEIH